MDERVVKGDVFSEKNPENNDNIILWGIALFLDFIGKLLNIFFLVLFLSLSILWQFG